jgi:hypothetical protein
LFGKGKGGYVNRVINPSSAQHFAWNRYGFPFIRVAV